MKIDKNLRQFDQLRLTRHTWYLKCKTQNGRETNIRMNLGSRDGMMMKRELFYWTVFLISNYSSGGCYSQSSEPEPAIMELVRGNY
jgi:hypothetical protein